MKRKQPEPRPPTSMSVSQLVKQAKHLLDEVNYPYVLLFDDSSQAITNVPPTFAKAIIVSAAKKIHMAEEMRGFMHDSDEEDTDDDEH